MRICVGLEGGVMRTGRLVIAVLLAAGPAWGQAAAPPGAEACSGCHALHSHALHSGAVTGMPPIRAKSADEIVAGMLAYRNGEGAPTVMDRISKGFSEEEIRAIAAWIIAQR
jgi:cytochrome subunit of sulfide dehydrogenase